MIDFVLGFALFLVIVFLIFFSIYTVTRLNYNADSLWGKVHEIESRFRTLEKFLGVDYVNKPRHEKKP